VDYIDLLLIHWPEKAMSLPETLGAMADLKHNGKIRHLGVSNFTTDWMRQALEATDQTLFCNQVEYHPYINQTPLLRFCGEHDIGVVAYSPLARGRVTKDDRLTEIGRKYDKSAAQIALRWLVQQPGVIAIPKGSSAGHIRENFEIFDFELDPDDHAAISAFPENKRLIDPDWSPDWDT
jgi:2,5-diketo-D-gluconate reductase B